MTNKIYELTDEQFINLIKESSNISEILFKLGYTVKGNSWAYSLIRQRMTDLNIGQELFKGKSPIINIQRDKIVNNKQIFTTNCKHVRSILRRAIIKDNLLPYKCAICGIDKWNGKTLSLEIDHINGINNDNRLENLRFLCPNCHSQTDTWRKPKKRIVVTDEYFVKALQNHRNIRQALLALGLSAKGANYNRARELIHKYNIHHLL